MRPSGAASAVEETRCGAVGDDPPPHLGFLWAKYLAVREICVYLSRIGCPDRIRTLTPRYGGGARTARGAEKGKQCKSATIPVAVSSVFPGEGKIRPVYHTHLRPLTVATARGREGVKPGNESEDLPCVCSKRFAARGITGENRNGGLIPDRSEGGRRDRTMVEAEGASRFFLGCLRSDARSLCRPFRIFSEWWRVSDFRDAAFSIYDIDRLHCGARSVP